jgi:hypothetical protein
VLHRVQGERTEKGERTSEFAATVLRAASRSVLWNQLQRPPPSLALSFSKCPRSSALYSRLGILLHHRERPAESRGSRRRRRSCPRTSTGPRQAFLKDRGGAGSLPLPPIRETHDLAAGNSLPMPHIWTKQRNTVD